MRECSKRMGMHIIQFTGVHQYKIQNIWIDRIPIIHQIQQSNPTQMPNWQYKTNYKPIWLITRFITNALLYYMVLHEPGFTDQLCGPLAIPIKPFLYFYVLLTELVYLMWPIAFNLLELIRGDGRSSRIYTINFVKYVFVTCVKIGIISAMAHRWKYYLHICIMEVVIFGVTILFDLTGNQKIVEVSEILLTSSLQKIAVFYALTRTFCPNFAIYCFFTNLLLLVMSQIQAHYFYFHPNSERMQPIYPACLYVKQDIYRIMILTFVYFGLFSAFQVSTYGYGMFVVFSLGCFPMLRTIRRIQAAEYSHSLRGVLAVFILLWGLILARITYPHLFLSLGSNLPQMCGIFDPR